MPNFKITNFKWIAVPVLFLALLTVMSATAGSVIDATQAGVIGDGATLNTSSIQKAIDDCSAAGGGTISFPAGRYLTGTIQLKSGVTLRLEDNATLLGSPNAADYRNSDPFVDGNGHPLGHALIVALNADHVGIEGNGTVNGQGPELKAHEHPFIMRPFLIRWVHCTNVTVQDVHLMNPGAWTLTFFQTEGALIKNVTIRTRGIGLGNNDGIDIDSSEHIQILNCDVNSGDDALVIKSTSAQPSRDIVARKCTFSSHCNAIKLGTESYGGFENILVTDCVVTNTDLAGIGLYTVDGGDLHNVTVRDIAIDGAQVPISIRLGERLKTFRTGDEPKLTPGILNDVTIKNVTAKNIGLIGILINGVPGHPVTGVHLENIQLELPGGGTAKDAKIQLPEKLKAYPESKMFGMTLPASSIYLRHVQGITLENIQTSLLKPDARPATILVDANDITPANFGTDSASPK